MNMLEPDWEQETPSTEDIQKLWQDFKVSPLPFHHPTLETLLRHLRSTHVNGGAEFARFQLLYQPALYWYGSRNRLDEIKFFERFLVLPDVKAALPSLKIKKRLTTAPVMQWSSAFTLDGELAETLVRGGAYKHFTGTGHEAKTLTQQVCDVLIEARYDEVNIRKSFTAWSEWFYDVAWDVTWFGFDKRHAQVWMLCVTDTD